MEKDCNCRPTRAVELLLIHLGIADNIHFHFVQKVFPFKPRKKRLLRWFRVIDGRPAITETKQSREITYLGCPLGNVLSNLSLVKLFSFHVRVNAIWKCICISQLMYGIAGNELSSSVSVYLLLMLAITLTYGTLLTTALNRSVDVKPVPFSYF